METILAPIQLVKHCFCSPFRFFARKLSKNGPNAPNQTSYFVKENSKGAGVELQNEVRDLQTRAFNAWDTEFIKQYKIKVVLVGTLTARTRTDKKRLVSLLDRWMWDLSKKTNRHLVLLFGAEDHQRTGTEPHIHIVMGIPENEGHTPVEVACIKKEANDMWVRRGIIKLDKPKGGRAIGYAVQKHDGNDQIMKIYCPKTNECSKGTKTDKRKCKYRRHPDLIMEKGVRL